MPAGAEHPGRLKPAVHPDRGAGGVRPHLHEVAEFVRQPDSPLPALRSQMTRRARSADRPTTRGRPTSQTSARFVPPQPDLHAAGSRIPRVASSSIAVTSFADRCAGSPASRPQLCRIWVGRFAGVGRRRSGRRWSARSGSGRVAANNDLACAAAAVMPVAGCRSPTRRRTGWLRRASTISASSEALDVVRAEQPQRGLSVQRPGSAAPRGTGIRRSRRRCGRPRSVRQLRGWAARSTPRRTRARPG